MSGNVLPLGRDEPIGVVALSGPVDEGAIEDGLSVLRSWGRPVVEAPNTRARWTYLAGTDNERLQGLHFLLERDIRIIIAARGGYGVTRLLGNLPWSRLVDSAVTFVGYSDLTALMNPLSARGGAVQIHGPVVTELDRRERDANDLLRLLEGGECDADRFSFAGDQVIHPGVADGPVVGGNLTMFAALAGTSFSLSFDGKIVFLEEVNEPAYRLDRLLTQIKSSGIFRGVKALISGNLHGSNVEADTAWRRLLPEVVPRGVPIVVGLPFGHGHENAPFPIGGSVEVDTRVGHLRWRN